MTLEEAKEKIKNWTKQDFRLFTKFYQDKNKFASQSGKFEPFLRLMNSEFPGMLPSEFSYILSNGLDSPNKCPTCGNNLEYRDNGLGYPKFCSRSCRTEYSIPNSDSVKINNVEYNSINHASRELKTDRWKVIQNILDPTMVEWMYTVDHDMKCFNKISQINPKLTDKEFLITWKASGKSVKELCDDLKITYSTVKMAFVYHGIETAFQQIGESAQNKLNDEEWFRKEYRKGGSPRISKQIGCSETTALLKAREYGIRPYKGSSAVEFEYLEFLESLGEYVIQGSFKILDNKRQIDLFIPEKNLGIEFDGLTYHGENSVYPKSDKLYHYDHMKMCRDKNILCMRFTDNETDSRPELVKSMISAKIGRSNTVIYSRKCKIVYVKPNAARQFFNRCHISGFCGAKYHIGLEYQGNLVLCMSFGHPRYRKSYDWEIVRLASELNTTIVGGAARCLNEFRKMHQGDTLINYLRIFSS